MRATIIETVRKQPGIHFRELSRNVGCTTTTLDYHLQRTERLRENTIRSYRRIFPLSIPEQQHSPLAALNHRTRGPLLLTIHNKDQAVLADLAEQVGKAVSTISRHLSILHDADLIRVSRHRRKRQYKISDRTVKALQQHGKNLLDTAAESFIDMWE